MDSGSGEVMALGGLRRLPVSRIGAWSSLLALMLVSCAVVDPVRPPENNRYFGRARVAEASASAASTPTPRSDVDCESYELGPVCFAGGLGLAIDDVDQRRIELVRLASQVTNGNAAYNALLYPLGGAAIYEKMRGAPNQNLLLPAVAAASLYGFVNAGVADRERHYLRAAGELHCAIVRSGAWLYPKGAVDAGAGQVAWHGETQPLGAVINSLDSNVRAFALERAKLVSELKPRPGTGPLQLDSVRRREAEARGRSLGGQAGQDRRDDIAKRTLAQLVYARKVLGQVAELRAHIARSGRSLRLQWTDIEQEFQTQLSERVPLPSAPEVVARNLLEQSNKLVTLQLQGVAVSDRPPADDLDPVFPADLRDGVSADSQLELTRFSHDRTARLITAIEDAEGWLARHADAQSRADDETRRLGCVDRLPSIPLRTSAPSNVEGARPGTAVSPTDKGSGTANQPSSRPLPPPASP